MIPVGKAGTQDEIMPIDCVSDTQTRQRHIDLAVARGLPQCEVGQVKKKKIAIVASAPSVSDYVKTLRDWDGEIWGINGAFAWMIHREIKPTAFIGVDPEEMLKDYLLNPPEEATYYLASQVHPGVFDHLSNRKVMLWHMSDREVKWPIGSVLVHGGSSCLTRAPWLACMLGYQDIHIFGGDSSFTHKTHVYGGALPTNFCFAEAGGEVFRTHKVMLVQACDVIDMIQSFPGSITVHGRGLMQSMAEDFKKSGVLEQLLKEEIHQLGNRKERRRMKA